MRHIVFALALALCAPPAANAAKKPEMTPMQLQAMQQKEFDAQKPLVFSSVVDVFQDLGYTIGSADLNTGFITAESATVNKTSFWDALGYSTGSGNTRATAFVEQMPSGMTRVRLNFVSTKTLSGMYGQNLRQDKPIQDPPVYQRAFEKIDEALFVRKATNAPAPANPPAPTPAAAPVAAEASPSGL
ncbi:hypothetical protein [Phenylobacterium sp.]|uniref:hypothetical protein n=1 Tax=Phenylobacterium sp. TaxID=1871053 RepID=UPI0039189297